MAQIETKTTTDEVLQEVWRIKEALAAEHDFDIDKIVDDIQERQNLSGHRLVPPPVPDNQA